MSKALVLFSGGTDSTTCLALAVEKYGSENVIALSVSYGQKHFRELLSAKKITEYYRVQHIEIDVSKIFENSDCSLLTSSEKEIPKESYAEQLKSTDGMPVSTYVPFRNGLFLSVSASVALANDCDVIYYGIHSDDSAGNAYPDCSQEFNEAINKAIFLGSGKQLSVIAPFVGMKKADVIKTGIALNVPYELTWSCYEGNDKPCGLCGTCRDRIDAFKKNGLTDPLMKGGQNDEK